MAKQGLSKRWKLKDQNWSHLGEEETVEIERGEQKRKKRRGRRRAKPKKGMDVTLDMISIMNHMDFVWDSRKIYEFQI